MEFSLLRRHGAGQPMCQIGAEALLAPQIEATYRLRYRQGGFTLCDIRIEVCQLSLFAALGHGEGKECFPKTIARAIVARLGTADQLPLLTFAQPVLHHPLKTALLCPPYKCFLALYFSIPGGPRLGHLSPMMPGRQFFSAYGRQAGVVLIRPDGYSGWRGRSCLEQNSTSYLRKVFRLLAAMLARASGGFPA